MKLRISSCKAAALRKDMSRFFPVWLAYILCLAVVMLMQGNGDMTYWYAANMAECIQVMAVINCAYAFIVAQMLFGDLYNSRMCSGQHAMPLKREHWFSVHVQAGFWFSLIPTALMTAVSMALICTYSNMADGWQIPLYWFAGVNLQYLFCFGLAVFSALCAGNRLGMTGIYGIVNFASLVLFFLVDTMYTPLLHGVVTQSTLFVLLSPVGQILSSRFIDCNRVPTGNTYVDAYGVEQKEYIGTFSLNPQPWVYLLAVAALGVVLLLLARQMYRKRHLERAGDFLAVRWLEPVFQVAFSVLCASGFYGVVWAFFGIWQDAAYWLLGTGLVAGWFAGRMFLERSIRVFRPKAFLGLALLAAVLAGSMYVTWLDPLGIEDWVPQEENVEYAQISMNWDGTFITEEPEEIRDLLRVHTLALEDKVEVHPDYTDDVYNESVERVTTRVTLTYILHNGWRTVREYNIYVDEEEGDTVREYTSRVDVVFNDRTIRNGEDLRRIMQDVEDLHVTNYAVEEELLTEEFLSRLADAIIADCENGNMCQTAAFHPGYVMDDGDPNQRLKSFYLDMHAYDFYAGIRIYADCENTLKVLEDIGILESVRQGWYY